MPRKLGIRAGDRVAALRPPALFRDILGVLPEGVALHDDPEDFRGRAASGDGEYRVVLAFCPDAGSLTELFDRGRRLLARDGGMWVCWPKLSSPLARDLRASDVREHGLQAGLVDNKVCAVDEDWSGLRFVYRLEDR